jgi:hypothetical protein
VNGPLLYIAEGSVSVTGFSPRIRPASLSVWSTASRAALTFSKVSCSRGRVRKVCLIACRLFGRVSSSWAARVKSSNSSPEPTSLLFSETMRSACSCTLPPSGQNRVRMPNRMVSMTPTPGSLNEVSSFFHSPAEVMVAVLTMSFPRRPGSHPLRISAMALFSSLFHLRSSVLMVAPSPGAGGLGSDPSMWPHTPRSMRVRRMSGFHTCQLASLRKGVLDIVVGGEVLRCRERGRSDVLSM